LYESKLFELLIPTAILLLGFLIRRWLGHIEKSIEVQGELNTREHQTIKHENGKAHDAMWDRINHHNHTDSGQVVIK
jgi:pantothenate kinase